MTRSRFLVPILGASFMALSVVPALAQDMRSMRQSFQTSGTLSWGNQTQNVQHVRVELDEDGDARLKFDTQERGENWGWREGDWKDWDQNLELDGVWLRDARGLSVDLRRGFNGQTIVGTARITMDEGLGNARPSQISLTGRVVRHPWDTLDLKGSFDFDSWDGGGNNNGGNNRLEELSTIKRGRGQFSDGDQTSDLSRAQITLDRDGTAKITLNGQQDWTFDGRWRQTTPDRIELRLDTFAAQNDRRVFDAPRPQRDTDSLGGGEIRLDGTRIVSLRLRGTNGTRDFDAQFEPQPDNGNDGPGDNGGWNRGPNNGGGWNGGPNNGNGNNGGGGWNRGPNNGGGWNGGPNNNNGGWNRPPLNGPNDGDTRDNGADIRDGAIGTLPPPPPADNPRPDAPPPNAPEPVRASWRGEALLKRADGNETISTASISLEQTGIARSYNLRLDNSNSHCTADITLNRGKIVALKISGMVDKAQTNLNLTT